MKTDETVVITADSIRIDTFHAGEHSGFVHTSRTAVRITHLPTGVTVESRDEPTAWRNRQKCLDMLPAAIAQHRSAGCTCPSGDGSLRHPCPVHPASVEQAGGDELEKFLAWACKEYGIEDKYDLNENHHSIRENKKGWMARAALAQPSPAQTQPSPAPTLRAAIDVANDRFEVPVAKWGTDLVGEEERPEVAEVAFVLRNIGAMDAEDIDGDNVDLRFEDAEGRDTGCDVSIVEYAEKAADLFEQHDRIVGELRADRDSWAEQAEQRLADWDEMRKERDAALARVSGLRSLLNPILCYVENDIERMRGDRDKSDNKEIYDLAISLAMERLKAAQHAVFTTEPGCDTAVELASHITAQAQHSVPEEFIGRLSEFLAQRGATGKALLRELRDMLAAAPGMEVPQAWLDVQAERRRQVTAEGWTPEHDDAHSYGQMARAAACYALAGSSAPNDGTAALLVSLAWPWDEQWWKPSTARRDMVKACALGLAEIERLDRASSSKEAL